MGNITSAACPPVTLFASLHSSPLAPPPFTLPPQERPRYSTLGSLLLLQLAVGAAVWARDTGARGSAARYRMQPSQADQRRPQTLILCQLLQIGGATLSPQAPWGLRGRGYSGRRPRAARTTHPPPPSPQKSSCWCAVRGPAASYASRVAQERLEALAQRSCAPNFRAPQDPYGRPVEELPDEAPEPSADTARASPMHHSRCHAPPLVHSVFSCPNELIPVPSCLLLA